MKKTILFLISFLLVVLGVYFFTRNNKNIEIKFDEQDISTTSVKDGCTRKLRLDNKPQYDRALSLIQQRINDNNEWWEKYGEENNSFKHFPPDLTNCIKIVEEDINSESEGYFIFNDERIKSNYFPITVDDNYNSTDDVMTALLLVHEMTHVQQYLNGLNGSDLLSCRDREIKAFISQIDFYVTLNNEENHAFVLRMDEKKNGKHPQVFMMKIMTEINRESTCGILDTECRDENLKNELFKLISENTSYQHQCDL